GSTGPCVGESARPAAGTMDRMSRAMFGTAAPALEAGARNAVLVCLAIQPDERVALIADEASGDVAASIAAALDEVGAPWQGVLIERVTSRPMTAAPPEVLDALEQADAGILCVQPQQGELGVRMAIVSGVGGRGVRYAHMVGVTPKIRQRGMRADSPLVDRLGGRLCERMPRAGRLRVEPPGGPALTAPFDPHYPWVKTSGLINRRYWSNLPA